MQSCTQSLEYVFQTYNRKNYFEQINLLLLKLVDAHTENFIESLCLWWVSWEKDARSGFALK